MDKKPRCRLRPFGADKGHSEGRVRWHVTADSLKEFFNAPEPNGRKPTRRGGSGLPQREKGKRRTIMKKFNMKKEVLLLLVVGSLTVGCASWGPSNTYSTNDIPLQNRKIAAYAPIIIGLKGPQLDPSYYDIMGKVKSSVDNKTIFERHCAGAIEMLRNEARSVGADALINVDCGSSHFGSGASGIAIAFKDRQESLKKLEEIKAQIK